MKPPTISSILIVDDTHENLKILGNILTGQGYKVAFADSGLQCLQIARKIIPDLILLDIAMAGIDGFETCQRLKEESATSEIPIIFLTAKTGSTDIVKSLDIGAIDYVAKPFNNRELLSRVKNHIEFKRNRELLEKEVEQRKAAQKKL